MTKEQIIYKLGKASVQNYIFNLGFYKYRNESKVKSIDSIIETGANELVNLISNNEVKLNKQNSLILVEPIIDYNTIKSAKVFNISSKPLELIANDYYINSDDKISAILIEHYAYHQITLMDSFVTNIIRKLNHIPLTINPNVLEYDRTPKSGNIDDNYKIETQLFRNAVNEFTDKVFYLGHRYDRRGRIYNDGYTLNYQGDEWSKCAINPVNNEIIEQKNIKYFYHDLANHYGLDKLTFKEKENWVNKHIMKIIVEGNDNRLDREFIQNADKKLLFKKACQTYTKIIKKEPVNYFCYNDATSSGLQILSILSNDTKIATLTNLTDNSKCYDLYSEITKIFIKEFKLKESIKDLRPYVKKIVMTHYYNSSKAIANTLQNMRIKFDSIRKNLKINVLVIKKFLDDYAIGPNIVMSEINKVFKSLPDTTTEIEYIMPDGFLVNLPLIGKRQKRLTTKYFSCSMRYDVNEYNYEENWRSLVPNIIHSIDSYICRQVIRKCPFEVLTIHDSFGCSANNVKQLKQIYTDILKDIQKMNMLEYILKQIDKDYKQPNFGKKFKIVSNNYAIC